MFNKMKLWGKIFGGFTIVLILLVITAYDGINCLDTVVDSANLTQDMDLLVKDILIIRQHEKNFMLRSDPQYIQKVTQTITDLISQTELAKEQFWEKERKDMMDQILRNIKDYKQSFDNFVQILEKQKQQITANAASEHVVIDLIESIRKLQQEELSSFLYQNQKTLSDTAVVLEYSNQINVHLLEIKNTTTQLKKADADTLSNTFTDLAQKIKVLFKEEEDIALINKISKQYQLFIESYRTNFLSNNSQEITPIIASLDALLKEINDFKEHISQDNKKTQKNSDQKIQDDMLRISELNELINLFADLRRDELEYVISDDSKLTVSMIERLDKMNLDLKNLTSVFKYEQGIQLLGKTVEKVKEYKQSVQLYINLSEKKKEIEGSLIEYARNVEKISDEANTEETKQMDGEIKRSKIQMIVVSVLAVLIGLTIAIFLTRAIVKPIKHLSDQVTLMAEGDLTIQIQESKRRDEVGVLVHGFKEMLDTLREQTREMLEGAGTLAASISEISTTVAEMATSSTQTSSSIAEITATVEEVRQTVQVSNEKADQVVDRAKKGNEISESGKKSTENTIEGIKRIREEMEYIAESIVKLSEQTQSIGQIISAVNDLADQSNLLSVNASIEAAKAGEHGKGFAVVAQEVKSLAEQSKEATNQVTSILNDIQKATSAAVMATERGGKAVEAGVELSAQAGEVIRILATNVMDSSQAALQIASSSQQQLIGMDQLAEAMENIKDASVQNADGAKQLDEAIKNMDSLAKKLKDLSQKFKV